MNEIVDWQISVSIFKNSTILKQLGIAIGIPFGILLVFMAMIKAYYGVMLVLLLLFSTWLFMMLVYGGKYDVRFVLDEQGVRCQTAQQQAKKNKFINGLTVILGLLSGKPTVAGAGILAQSRQDVMMKWKRVRKVRYKAKSYTIAISGGFAEHIAIFCTRENYDEAVRFVQGKFGA